MAPRISGVGRSLRCVVTVPTSQKALLTQFADDCIMKAAGVEPNVNFLVYGNENNANNNEDGLERAAK